METEKTWGEVTEGLVISISTANRKYRPPDSITLDIAIKNVTDAAVPIVVRSAWSEYAITVTKGGQAISKTDYAERMIEGAEVGSRAMSELMPGEIEKTSIELDKGFEMSAPGLYKVVVTRGTFKIGKTSEFETVTSNDLTVEVSP